MCRCSLCCSVLPSGTTAARIRPASIPSRTCRRVISQRKTFGAASPCCVVPTIGFSFEVCSFHVSGHSAVPFLPRPLRSLRRLTPFIALFRPPEELAQPGGRHGEAQAGDVV